MKVIIGSRQSGRTIECIRYCINHAKKQLDDGKYRPSLLVVFSEEEKQRLVREWNGVIRACLLEIITFTEYIDPKFTTNQFINSVGEVVIDNLDKCLETLNPNCRFTDVISVLGDDNDVLY